MNFNERFRLYRSGRAAIAMGIDKKDLWKICWGRKRLSGKWNLPAGSAFWPNKVTTETYDAEGAKKVLEAGWTDKDGDSIREKTDRSFRSNEKHLSKQTGASASGRIHRLR